jgi:hypothetical protein
MALYLLLPAQVEHSNPGYPCRIKSTGSTNPISIRKVATKNMFDHCLMIKVPTLPFWHFAKPVSHLGLSGKSVKKTCLMIAILGKPASSDVATVGSALNWARGLGGWGPKHQLLHSIASQLAVSTCFNSFSCSIPKYQTKLKYQTNLN